jgi:hypothetical protein
MMEETVQVEQQEATQETPEVAKYTDKQLNDLIAKNARKAAEKAQAALLENAGVKSLEELVELQKLRTEKLSESERAAARIAELETGNKAAHDRAERAEAKAEALALSVPADKADRVVKLALSGDYEGETVAEKVSAVIAEFPEFAAKARGPEFGLKTESQAPSKAQASLDIIRKNMA